MHAKASTGVQLLQCNLLTAEAAQPGLQICTHIAFTELSRTLPCAAAELILGVQVSPFNLPRGRVFAAVMEGFIQQLGASDCRGGK
jgi:hypothetical protein